MIRLNRGKNWPKFESREYNRSTIEIFINGKRDNYFCEGDKEEELTVIAKMLREFLLIFREIE